MSRASYAAIGAVAIAFCIIVAYYDNAFAPWGYPRPGALQPNQQNYQPVPRVPAPTAGAYPAGTFTIVDNAYNTLDISSALTLGGHVDQSFWAYRNGRWILLGGHGATGTNVEVTTDDQGYIYVLMAPVSGQSYIADVARTVAMNARAAGSRFVDVTIDNKKEFMVQWNMANIPKARSGYPSTTFTGYYYQDISASAALNVPLMTRTYTTTSSTTSVTTSSTTSVTSSSTTSDATSTTTTDTTTDASTSTTTIVSIESTTVVTSSSTTMAASTISTTKAGTTKTSSSTSSATTGITGPHANAYIPMYATLGTVKTGLAVFKVEVKCNTSSANSAKAALVSINVPGKGLILASSCAYAQTDSYQIWDYNIGTDLSGCLFWAYPQNTYDKQDLSTGVQLTMSAGDVIRWTFNIYCLNAAQSVVILTGYTDTTFS